MALSLGRWLGRLDERGSNGVVMAAVAAELTLLLRRNGTTAEDNEDLVTPPGRLEPAPDLLPAAVVVAARKAADATAPVGAQTRPACTRRRCTRGHSSSSSSNSSGLHAGAPPRRPARRSAGISGLTAAEQRGSCGSYNTRGERRPMWRRAEADPRRSPPLLPLQVVLHAEPLSTWVAAAAAGVAALAEPCPLAPPPQPHRQVERSAPAACCLRGRRRRAWREQVAACRPRRHQCHPLRHFEAAAQVSGPSWAAWRAEERR